MSNGPLDRDARILYETDRLTQSTCRRSRSQRSVHTIHEIPIDPSNGKSTIVIIIYVADAQTDACYPAYTRFGTIHLPNLSRVSSRSERFQ